MMYRDSAFLQKLYPEVLCTLLIPQTQSWVIVIFFPSSRIVLPTVLEGKDEQHQGNMEVPLKWQRTMITCRDEGI